jgi:hypothetical protein
VGKIIKQFHKSHTPTPQTSQKQKQTKKREDDYVWDEHEVYHIRKTFLHQ